MLYTGNEEVRPQREEFITGAEWFSREKLPSALENTYGAVRDVVALS